MSLCVGLTGGVASGKSCVGEAFAALGVPTVDADQVAREVVSVGSPGLAAVIAHFGDEFALADGTLDRARMRQEVFSADERRRELEQILHPLIRQGLRDWRAALSGAYGLMMVPILIEGGFDTLCDRILVIDTRPELQLQRLCQRDGIDRALAESMLRAQATREERLARADDIIDNTGTLAELLPQVQTLHQKYLQLALAH